MADLDRRIAVSREEAADLVGMHPRLISEAIHRVENRLPAKKVGRRYFIAVDDLRAWIAQLPDA